MIKYNKVAVQFYDLAVAIEKLPNNNDTLLMIMQFMEDLSVTMAQVSENIIMDQDKDFVIKNDEYVTALMNESLISISNNINMTKRDIKDQEYGL
jgi:hypothetical protein